MVVNSIVFFVSLMASYFLFFYNAPYWTGKDMADMSPGGIWRAFFRVLSFPGYGLYKLYRFVVDRIVAGILSFIGTKILRRTDVPPEDHIIWNIGDVLCALFFTAALFLVTFIYNGFMNSFFPAGISDLAEGGGGILSRLSQAVVFLRVVVSYTSDLGGASFGNVAAAVIVTLVALILYVAINTFYFSTLFGFLRQALDEVDLSERFSFLKQSEPEPPAEGEAQNVLGQLGDTLLNAFKGFCNKLTILYHLRDRISLIIFLVLGLGFSFLMTALGQDNIGPLDVIAAVLESVGVVQLIGAFIVTWLANKALSKGAEGVVSLLPEGIQQSIRKLSDRGNDWANRQDARRREAAGREPEPVKEAARPAPADREAALPRDIAGEAIDFILDAAKKEGLKDVSVEDLVKAMEKFEPKLLAEWRSKSTPEEEYEFLLKHVPDILGAILRARQ